MEAKDKCAKFGRYLKRNINAYVESTNPIRVEWNGGRVGEISANLKKPIDIESEEYACFGGASHEPKNADKTTDNFTDMLRHVALEHWKDMKFQSYEDAADCVSWEGKKS
jgi:hypothetical protein